VSSQRWQCWLCEDKINANGLRGLFESSVPDANLPAGTTLRIGVQMSVEGRPDNGALTTSPVLNYIVCVAVWLAFCGGGGASGGASSACCYDRWCNDGEKSMQGIGTYAAQDVRADSFPVSPRTMACLENDSMPFAESPQAEP